MHKFNSSGASLDAIASEVSRKREDAAAGRTDHQVRRDQLKRALGHDEVLRFLLVQKKIIAPEDLEQTEQLLIDAAEWGRTVDADTPSAGVEPGGGHSEDSRVWDEGRPAGGLRSDSSGPGEASGSVGGADDQPVASP